MFIKNTIEAPQAPDEDLLFPVDSSSTFSPTAAQKKGESKKEGNNNPRSPRGLNNPGPGNEYASYLVYLSPSEEASAIGSMLQIFKGPCVLPNFWGLFIFLHRQ